MTYKIKTYLFGLILVFGLAGLLAVPLAPVNAQSIKGNLCEGAELSVGDSVKGCPNGAAAASSLDTLIKNIVNVLSVIVGIVAVIMIIIGGFKYITSAGDSANITSAKNTIVYAIVGLVIVALAQVIVRFVLSKTT